jgi:hypothetical protein
LASQAPSASTISADGVGEIAGEELRACPGEVSEVEAGGAGFPQARREATKLAQATLAGQDGRGRIVGRAGSFEPGFFARGDFIEEIRCKSDACQIYFEGAREANCLFPRVAGRNFHRPSAAGRKSPPPARLAAGSLQKAPQRSCTARPATLGAAPITRTG